MGDLQPHEIAFIIDPAQAAAFAAFPQQIMAAKLLSGGGASTPPPTTAAPAAAAGGNNDPAALKTRMGELMQSMPVFGELANARKFFEKMTGVKAINKMSPEQLAQCVATAEQGEAAVQAVLAKAA